jgi:hypothetical protein
MNLRSVISRFHKVCFFKSNLYHYITAVLLGVIIGLERVRSAILQVKR